MTVALVVRWEARPGRIEEALALAGEGRKRMEQQGYDNVRVVHLGAGAPNMRTFATYGEAASNAALGALWDTDENDADFQSFVQRVQAADSPIDLGPLMLSRQLLAVNVRNRPAPRSGVTATYQVGGGREQEALDLASEWSEVLARLGAEDIITASVVAGGPDLRTFMTSYAAADQAALGSIEDAVASDAQAVALTARTSAADAASTDVMIQNWNDLAI